MKPQIKFNDWPYTSNHGAKPRGRGGWAFALSPEAASQDIWFAPGSLTYTEAKRAAKAYFEAQPHFSETVTIYVMP